MRDELARFGQPAPTSKVVAVPNSADPASTYLAPDGVEPVGAAFPAVLRHNEFGNYTLSIFEPGSEKDPTTGEKFEKRLTRYTLSESGEVLAREESSAAITYAVASPDGSVDPSAPGAVESAGLMAMQVGSCWFGVTAPYPSVGVIGDIVLSTDFINCSVPGVGYDTVSLWELWVGIWNSNYRFQVLQGTVFGYLMDNSTWKPLGPANQQLHSYGTTQSASATLVVGALAPVLQDAPALYTTARPVIP